MLAPLVAASKIFEAGLNVATGKDPGKELGRLAVAGALFVGGASELVGLARRELGADALQAASDILAGLI